MATYLAGLALDTKIPLVGAHRGPSDLSAADPAHQTSAPRPQSVFDLPLARRLRQDPTLAGDEDFGLDTGKDLTQVVALQAYSCVECGRCTEHCPANNTGKILDPKKIALGVSRLLERVRPRL